jgi:protease I
MAGTLRGRKVAILVANEGIEQVELTEPRKALEEAVQDADAGDYDALMLPGGVANPDNLRTHPEAVAFVRAFFDAGKPVAAICHAPWTLIEADVVRGRTLTSWPSVQTDLRNAGATWVDEEVVVDDGLVTSRKPDDLPAFTTKMVEEFAGRFADVS